MRPSPQKTPAFTYTLACLATLAGCAPVDDLGQEVQALTATQTTKLFTAARLQIGTAGGVCKIWVQNIFRTALSVTIPATAAAPYEWASSSAVTVTAAWRATYAVARLDGRTVGGLGTVTQSFTVNSDPYLIVIYSTTALSAQALSGSTAVASVTAVQGGALSGDFHGAGTYVLSVRNPSASAATFTAVVLSRSRFESDYATAQRGDVLQMYVAPNTVGTRTPHTAIIQTAYNAGTNNWLDSNFAYPEDGIVREHTVPVNTMIKYAARYADLGFNVYRVN